MSGNMHIDCTGGTGPQVLVFYNVGAELVGIQAAPYDGPARVGFVKCGTIAIDNTISAQLLGPPSLSLTAPNVEQPYRYAWDMYHEPLPLTEPGMIGALVAGLVLLALRALWK